MGGLGDGLVFLFWLAMFGIITVLALSFAMIVSIFTAVPLWLGVLVSIAIGVVGASAMTVRA